MSKINPFDYVSAVSDSKKDLMRGTENDALSERDYSPWLTNKAFSYHPDAVLHANQMNELSHLDNKLQFEYLLNNIRPRKRWSKWLKPDKIDNLEIVKVYFGFGNEKAKDALDVLTTEDIEDIKSKLAKGGMEKPNDYKHRRDD